MYWQVNETVDTILVELDIKNFSADIKPGNEHNVNHITY